MTLWITLATVVVILLWRLGMKPAANGLESPETVTLTLRYLLTNGVDGGQVRFQPRDDVEPSLTFVKCVRAQNDVGLRTTFTESRGSTGNVDRLRQELREKGIAYTEGATNGQEYLSLDFGSDLGLAQLVARIVFERVYQIRLEKKCVAYYKDVLISNVPHLTGVDDNVR